MFGSVLRIAHVLVCCQSWESLDKQWKALIQAPLKTTVGDVSLFDNIWINASATSEWTGEQQHCVVQAVSNSHAVVVTLRCAALQARPACTRSTRSMRTASRAAALP